MMMKKILLLVSLSWLSFQLKAQETKNIVVDGNAEIRTVEAFEALNVSGAIDVYVSQGTENAVAVSATTDDARNRIKTTVSNGVLRIWFEGSGMNWRSWTNTKSKAYITVKNLNKIVVSGASNIKITDILKVEQLRVELTGASDCRGKIEADNLMIDVSGASSMIFSGTSKNAKLEASGASSIKGYDHSTDFCTSEASGAASIRITVNKELKATASGASSIYYKGEGVGKEIESSGGSSIRKKAEN